jgi:ABC-type multidrug transport system ATPase subunit
MAVLRMRDARFVASGSPVGPISVEVCAGARIALVGASAREASITALLAAGIVKAGTGIVLIEEYDPRVQPAHCKRVVGFVPHAPLSISEAEFEWYVKYRAALWNVDPVRALSHAKLTLERLEGIHEAFAYPIAAALVSSPKLLVLDRPQAEHAQRIVAAAGPRAIFSTHLSDAGASAFSSPSFSAKTVFR